MIYKIDNKVFGHIFYFVINEKWDKKKMEKTLNKIHFTRDDKSARNKSLEEITKDIETNPFAHATTYTEIQGITIIYFYFWNGDASDYGALQHEIFHGVDVMLRFRGLRLSDDSDEAYAYCIGHLTREVYNLIFKDEK